MPGWAGTGGDSRPSRSASGCSRGLQVEHRAVVLGGVPGAQRVVVGLDVGQQPGTLLGVQQGGRRGHRARGVLDPDHRPVVLRVDLDRRVRARGGRAAHQQRDGQAATLHLGGHRHHLVERGGDQAGQADDVGPDLDGGVEDLLGWHHHAEVDDLVVVALQHDPDILNNPTTGQTARKLYDDGQEMLDRIIAEDWLTANAVYGFFPANAVGDDLELYADASRTDRGVAAVHLQAGEHRPGAQPIAGGLRGAHGTRAWPTTWAGFRRHRGLARGAH